MADFEEKDKQLAFARAILQRIIARMHDAPDDHHEESVQAIYNGLVVAYERGARKENEGCAKASCSMCREGDVRYREHYTHGDYVHIIEEMKVQARCNANHILARMEGK
jgi:hypothetical protein